MKIPCLAALAALALACSPANVGGAGGAGASGGDGGDTQQVCAAYAYALCGRLQACSPTSVQVRYGDVNTCELIERTQCTNASAAPMSGSTLADKQACTAAIATWACGELVHDQNPPPHCGVIAGSLANGAACAISSQCQSAYCNFDLGRACGVCAPAPQPGGSCAEALCPQGLSCFGSPPLCVSYAQMGAQCSAAQPCDTGLTCVSGTCTPGVTTLGAPCNFTGAGCDYYSGLACNAATGTCQTARVSQPGQACGLVANQEAYCAMGSCPRGSCVGDVPVGGACELGGTACVAASRCIVGADGGTSGTCQINGSTACN